jgi:MoaA/NifB/PqqE/SkfB family radical SAM enzyme
MNYLRNLARLALGQTLLDPLVAIYYITTHCNLNCAYCEDFGARRNAENQPPAPLADAKQILRIIRSGVDSLWITGGEPLLVPHLPELLEYARRELRFRQISLITNGTLLPSKQDGLLPHLDRLIISLDSLDPMAWSALNMPATYAESILDIVCETAKLQKKHHYQLILNSVITPESLETANGQRSTLEDLIQFCKTHNAQVSFSPQSTNNWPRYELITSPTYQAFLSELATRKKQGDPILGSDLYLQTLRENRPYDCYPSLAPRITPNGDLTYPCRPIEKAGGEQGGRPVNLLDVADWKSAIKIASEAYGDPPTMCVSCFQQCYAEPSLMQARPLAFLREGKSLTTYVPG